HLWRPAGARGTGRPGCSHRPQAGGAPHAGGRLGRREPAGLRHDHAPGPRGPTRPGSRPPPPYSRPPRPAVGGGHHLTSRTWPGLLSLAVVLAAWGRRWWAGHGHPPPHGVGPRRPEHTPVGSPLTGLQPRPYTPTVRTQAWSRSRRWVTPRMSSADGAEPSGV